MAVSSDNQLLITTNSKIYSKVYQKNNKKKLIFILNYFKNTFIINKT